MTSPVVGGPSILAPPEEPLVVGGCPLSSSVNGARWAATVSDPLREARVNQRPLHVSRSYPDTARIERPGTALSPPATGALKRSLGRKDLGPETLEGSCLRLL